MKKGLKTKMEEPSLIVFDFETSPQLGYFWGNIWETNIIKIMEYETVVCVSYWDSKTKKVKNLSQWDFPGWKKGKWNDKALIKAFREIIIGYDIIAGQNSDQFDIKVLNARLAFHGFDPIPTAKTFDTKKIAKGKLKLPSYSLEIMANFFGFEGKFHHSGLDMWFGCRDGVKSFQKEMVHYCNIDVIKTKDVLYKLLPFVSFNQVANRDIQCGNAACMSTALQKRGTGVKNNGVRVQRYQCTDCGAWSQGKIT